MLPLVALVGRPNVGKSALFNQLIGTRQALVADVPGLTRDRHYGFGRCGERDVALVDTGGLEADGDAMAEAVRQQTLLAIDEADLLLLVGDARQGLLPADRDIAALLRRGGKRWFLIVNKIDGVDLDAAVADFSALGAEKIMLTSAARGFGIGKLGLGIQDFLPACPDAVAKDEDAMSEEEGRGVKVAIIGRPNAGKSTLVNRLIGEDRLIVSDKPGATRDSIDIACRRNERDYTLVDTAGLRHRSKVREVAERFSALMALQAIDGCDVAVLLVDAAEGIVEQDKRIASLAMEAGCATLIVLNKSDLLNEDERRRAEEELRRQLRFAEHLRWMWLSALGGEGVGHLFACIDELWDKLRRPLPTGELNRILQKALEAHPPPHVGRRAIKLSYAHAGGTHPPLIVVHGNRADRVPDAYRRYLENCLRADLKLSGVPIRLVFRSGENPYAPEAKSRGAGGYRGRVDRAQRRRPR